MHERIIVAGIIQKDNYVLFGKKLKDRPPYPNVWHIPGGGIDDDFAFAKKLITEKKFENKLFHEELKREIKEETGLEIKNIKCVIPEYRENSREMETENKHGEMTHYYFLEYLCEYENGDPKPNDDLVELKWVQKNEIKDLVLTIPGQELFRELKLI